MNFTEKKKVSTMPVDMTVARFANSGKVNDKLGKHNQECNEKLYLYYLYIRNFRL